MYDNCEIVTLYPKNLFLFRNKFKNVITVNFAPKQNV